jgi:hypothetical protein
MVANFGGRPGLPTIVDWKSPQRSPARNIRLLGLSRRSYFHWNVCVAAAMAYASARLPKMAIRGIFIAVSVRSENYLYTQNPCEGDVGYLAKPSYRRT